MGLQGLLLALMHVAEDLMSCLLHCLAESCLQALLMRGYARPSRCNAFCRRLCLLHDAVHEELPLELYWWCGCVAGCPQTQ